MQIATELPYHPDSAMLFEHLADRPWAVFLDSGRPLTEQGRYDILAADPFVTLVTRGGLTEIRGPDHCALSQDDPFALVREQIAIDRPPIPGLPFCGGAIGWFGYDLGRRIERLPELAEDAEQIPDMAVGLYDWALVVDHAERRTRLVSAGRDPGTAGRWEYLGRLLSRPPPHPKPRGFRVRRAARANMTRTQYGAAFDRIKRYIRNGDCYQVNLAQRFAAPASGDPWQGFRELRRLNPAPFSAYLGTPYARVLSSSPERFLQLREGEVATKPIKGTRARGGCPESDSVLAMELSQSAKDHAENVMIVDLLRNDIGRVCRTGSVRVPKLCAVESFATVHHLVSTVTGSLRSGEDATSLLRACFPGGSITGAPKIRSMEIIEEVEPHRRGVYCGSIGYLGFDGAMDSNIAIRTLVHSDGVIRCWAGGGIVHDSDADAEYQETFDKAWAMLRLLEPQALADVGG
ncbi:MAG: aminodeoxychorismate synthase component I [Thiohalocapsa sp.]